MATPVPDSEGTDATPGATNAPPVAAAARIRADALASAQRLVEAARRSADELHAQATRQAEAMLHAARAEVEHLTEEANSRDVAKTVQQVSWDAPGRVLEAASAEADLIRAEAQAAAAVLLTNARRQAEREASQVLRAARDQVTQEQQQAAGELQAVGDGLAQLHRESIALWERLERTRTRLATLASASPDGRQSPPPRTAPSDALLTGELNLVLPERADRTTVEVMIAVLRDQPGIAVHNVSPRPQGLVIPLVVDRPVPLIPILQELPRVVAAVYSPPNGAAGNPSGGAIVLEFGDR